MLINKISQSSVIDFAATELKKYMYMMMPECSDVEIHFVPDATNGLRLGLMSDFGLDCSDVENPEHDDVVYIDCNSQSGIIAGSNERSVLIAVYEYLRRNGCHWLFPGVDGEYIPIKSLNDVKCRCVASSRYRGPCIEGTVSQQILLDFIEFMPKVGMNLFSMQFFVPTTFYKYYYSHNGSSIRVPESVTEECILQWKRAAEAELARRGISFYDVGHGWTAAPFGIDCSSGWDVVDEAIVPKNSIKFLAEIGGKRGLFKSRVLNTQFCMSNTEARKKVAEYFVDYAKKHSNARAILFSLGDDYNNHCECAECAQKTPSDWYVIQLNEIDAALTKENIPTRIVFSTYTETNWAPTTEKIVNPDRFTLQIAPIDRKYTETLTDRECVIPPYVRNKVVLPGSLDESLAYFKSWSNAFNGESNAFEYHFWRHQFYDLSGQVLAKRLFEDIEAYLDNSFNGMIACGSLRSYFPNGFAYYLYARKLFDSSLSYDAIAEDYYSNAYGEDWRKFYDYLSSIEKCISFSYLEGECSEDYSVSPYFSSECADKMKEIPNILGLGRELIYSHYNSKFRVRTVSVRLLEEHANYVEKLVKALQLKAKGNDSEAIVAAGELFAFISEREFYTERYFDMYYASAFTKQIIEAHGVAEVKVVM